MSSYPFIFDGSSYLLHQNLSPEEIVLPETELLFGDYGFSPFSDSPINIFEALSDHTQTTTTNQQQNPQTNAQISPPTQQFQTLNHNNIQTESPNGFGDFHEFYRFPVKTEECQAGFDSNDFYCNSSDNISLQNLMLGARSCSGDGVENVAKLIQRSFSSNSFEQKPYPEFPFSPSFDAVTDSQSFENQALSSFENGFVRRVCSTGDLQSFGTVRTTRRSLSSPFASESSLMEETSFKVGKYSPEEKKERILKYRAKRTLRNFNKTIKYACRKTLADSRPRIRGRFARNDEPGGFDAPKAPPPPSLRPGVDDDDDLWLEGLHEEEEGTDPTVTEQFVNICGPTQFHYYGF